MADYPSISIPFETALFTIVSGLNALSPNLELKALSIFLARSRISLSRNFYTLILTFVTKGIIYCRIKSGFGSKNSSLNYVR